MSIIGGPGRGPVTGDASPYVGGTNEPEGVCRMFYFEGTEVQPLAGLVNERAPKGRPTRSRWHPSRHWQLGPVPECCTTLKITLAFQEMKTPVVTCKVSVFVLEPSCSSER